MITETKETQGRYLDMMADEAMKRTAIGKTDTTQYHFRCGYKMAFRDLMNATVVYSCRDCKDLNNCKCKTI